ncbi:MAG TPA: MFS transporter [Nocardioidaceae bacterium]|nr:MFS transporter [Nocardioidaceae bacterium]
MTPSADAEVPHPQAVRTVVGLASRRGSRRGVRPGAGGAHRKGGAEPVEDGPACVRCRDSRTRPRVRRAQGAGPGRCVRRTAAGRRGRRSDRRDVGGPRRPRRPGRGRHGCLAVRAGKGARHERLRSPGRRIREGRRRDHGADRPAGTVLPLRDVERSEHLGPDDLRGHLLPSRRRRPGRPALVPVVYAVAMLTAAAAALVTGFAYDRCSAKVLLVLPFLVAAVPVLTLADRLWVAVVGVAVWGGAGGVQESTVKALVADLVPARRLATAYGVFAAFEGAAALLGGGLAGALYSGGRNDLITVIAICQAASLILLVAVFRALGH